MGKNKRQVKFESKHLKAAIKHRKDVQKSKRIKATAAEALEKKRTLRESEAEAKAKDLAALNVDELMEGGFLGGSDDELASDGGSDSDDDLSGIEVEEDDEASPSDGEGGSDGDVDGAESDADEGSDDPAAAPTARARTAISGHKAELEKLKEADPAFYEFLRKADKNLLAFEDGDEGEEEEEEEGEGDATGRKDGKEGDEDAAAASSGESEDEAAEETRGTAAAKALSDRHGALDLKRVKTWCAAARSSPPSLAAVRSLLQAFRAACHYGDSEEAVEQTLRIASSAVFNHVVLFALAEMDGVLKAALGLAAKGADLKPSHVARASRFERLKPLVKSYLGNTTHLLGTLTDASMRSYVFRRLRASVPLIVQFPRLAKKLAKLSLEEFGSTAAGASAARVQAVLLARSLMRAAGGELREAVLKGAYRAHAGVARAAGGNAAAAAELGFMRAAVVELVVDDPAAAYPVAFGFVRQIAVSLRDGTRTQAAPARGGGQKATSVRNPSVAAKSGARGSADASGAGGKAATAAAAARKQTKRDAAREVLNWQTLASLELWVDACAAAPESPDLRLLAYPVSQLLFGVARLRPSPSYFPLRLRCAGALTRLGSALGMHVPVAPLLLEILAWPELARRPAGSGGRGGAAFSPSADSPDPLRSLRASSGALASPAWREEIGQAALTALSRWLANASRHVAFPELSRLCVSSLRRFAKGIGSDALKKAARTVSDGAERNAAWVAEARERADFAPRDAAQVARFLKDVPGASPMERVDDIVAEKARERARLRSTTEVQVGGGAAAAAGADGDDAGLYGSDDETTAAAAPDARAVSTPAEAKAAARARKEAEAARLEAEAKRRAERGEGDDEDLVGEYELSSDEDGEDGEE